MEIEECYYEGCHEVAVVKNLCLKHYNLWFGNIENKGKRNRSSAERFWSFVWKPKKDACWIWRGRLESGYGRLQINNKSVRAHRFSWELHYGDVPDNLEVLHKCDNPACVNPQHLFLGTHQDNMRDMVEKGRSYSSCGIFNGNSKLTENKVLEIRSLRKTFLLPYRAIAKLFSVDSSTIYDIIQYKNWNYPEILRREANV